MKYKDKKVVQVYVSDDMYAQIKELSDNHELTVSSYLRQLIKKGLDNAIMLEDQKD